MTITTREIKTLKIAKPLMLACCVFIAASTFAARPALGQRGWHQGDMWLKWGHDARESYVLGYFEGSMADRSSSSDQSSKSEVLEVDTDRMAKAITDFYTRYPEDRDIYIREIIEQLRKGLTLEQIHAHPFWRHEAPKEKP